MQEYLLHLLAKTRWCKMKKVIIKMNEYEKLIIGQSRHANILYAKISKVSYTCWLDNGKLAIWKRAVSKMFPTCTTWNLHTENITGVLRGVSGGGSPWEILDINNHTISHTIKLEAPAGSQEDSHSHNSADLHNFTRWEILGVYWMSVYVLQI